MRKTLRKDTILALGCSYTDQSFEAKFAGSENVPRNVKTGWPMWPQLFQEKMIERDKKRYYLINAGKSGTSMEYASRMFFSNWVKNKDRLKVVLWGGTGYFRMDHFAHDWLHVSINHFGDNSKFTSSHFNQTEHLMKKHGMEEYVKYSASRTINKEMYVRQCKINLEKIVTIRDLCQAHGVDFIYYPILSPYDSKTYKGVGGREQGMSTELQLQYLYEASPEAWEEICHSKNFIGIINHGFNWQHWAAKVNYYHSNGIDCLIEHNKEYPNNDTHPNKKGQEMIAEEFWSHYEKNF